jgi:hypothetical protein
MGSGLVVRVRYRTLEVAVIRLVLSMSLVFDVVAIVFFTLHDSMDDAWGGGVLAIVIEVTSKFSLFTLAVVLVDVAAGVATTPILVEVGT